MITFCFRRYNAASRHFDSTSMRAASFGFDFPEKVMAVAFGTQQIIPGRNG